ncbi:MAG: hypothetical protein H0T51_24520 [Pirellulales bacterium]|nr:hypothetical protein [Pirellulales bacterium]
MRPNEPPAVVAIPADVVEPQPSDLPRVEFAHASPRPLSNGRLSTGLIGLRQRAISNAWADTTNFTVTTGDAAAPTPQTAREMMEELLPAESARRTSDWPWKLTSPGDSI